MAARTGKAQLVGLVGEPLTHSLSPFLHERWIAQHGLDACYLPFRQKAADFKGLMAGLRGLDMTGFNLTVPYKQMILPLLDSLDPIAEKIGAVNTVVVDAAGKWQGKNTDSAGFLRQLYRFMPSEKPLGKVAILGAGGAARAIMSGLLEAGATDILLLNRSRANADALAEVMQCHYPSARIEGGEWEAREAAIRDRQLLVNTTSLGMTGMPPLEIRLDALANEAVVVDIVYSPLETPLLKAARQQGLTAVDGLGMLIGQAAAAFELWFGTPAIWDDAVFAEASAMLAGRQV